MIVQDHLRYLIFTVLGIIHLLVLHLLSALICSVPRRSQTEKLAVELKGRCRCVFCFFLTVSVLHS